MALWQRGATMLSAILALSLLPGVAGAQEGSAARTGADGGEATGDGQRARPRRARTGPEQIAEAARIERRAELLSRRVQQQLDEARRSGLAPLVTCLDDVLSQVNSLRRMIRRRAELLDQAIRLSDAARRRHAFSVLTVMGRRIGELDRASRACHGERPDSPGRTRVTVTIDRSVPREDPTSITDRSRFGTPWVPPPGSPIM